MTFVTPWGYSENEQFVRYVLSSASEQKRGRLEEPVAAGSFFFNHSQARNAHRPTCSVQLHPG